ncbi:MAG: diguanylate cyclase [Chloroflexi bacterium]|nr:diguanylate cyclase [Chloroflexota bacterium]
MVLLLRIMGLLAPAAIAVRVAFVPAIQAALGLPGETERLILENLLSGLVGAGLAALLASIWIAFRLRRLAVAAERMATGEYGLRLKEPRERLERQLVVAINTLGAALSDTHSAATTDELTGVANRQVLLPEVFNEVERANRYGRPLSVALVDIDHFKSVNDTYGHKAGDLVLRRVATLLRQNIRATDTAGRYGGEEFMLLLPETDVEEASRLAEKLRLLVMREKVRIDGRQEIGVTISIGVAGGPGKQVRFDTIVRDADAAMCSAKNLGRNQTYIFAEPDEDSRVPRAPVSVEGRARAVAIGRVAREAAQRVIEGVVEPLPHYRGRPSKMLAEVASRMAEQLALPEAEIDRIRVASLLHDVGKVAIPEEILEKPAPLTTVEWQSVVQHPRIGQLILEQAGALRDAAPIILHHHERFGGHGYPYGLRGQDIPLGARIVAVADAYDAMMHDRPYKAAIGHARAVAELRRHAGTQFDPELVKLFCDLFGAGVPGFDEAHAAQPAATRAARRRSRRTDAAIG